MYHRFTEFPGADDESARQQAMRILRTAAKRFQFPADSFCSEHRLAHGARRIDLSVHCGFLLLWLVCRSGHGETGLRCGASRTWDYASERSAAKSHVRMPSRRHTRLPSIPVDSCRLGLRFGTFRSEIPCADAIFNLTRLSTFE